MVDSNENLCKNLTKDNNIRKLINKYDVNLNKTIEIIYQKTEEISIIDKITYKPPLPFKATGIVDSMGAFIFYYRERFFELDPAIGSVKRFKSINDYPNNPL